MEKVENGQTVYLLITDRYNGDTPRVLTVATSKDEVRKICEEHSYTWDGKDGLFVNPARGCYIRVDSVIINETWSGQRRIDFGEDAQ